MPGSADLIEISGLRVVARHGVLPEERERAQPFEVDVRIEADLSEAGRSDDLAATVDYGRVAVTVADVAVRESFLLLETLAEAIAAAVLVEERASAVTVAVRKLRPPIAADVASVGVTIRRARPAD
jgi:dihydroneopterin aldolase